MFLGGFVGWLAVVVEGVWLIRWWVCGVAHGLSHCEILVFGVNLFLLFIDWILVGFHYYAWKCSMKKAGCLRWSPMFVWGLRWGRLAVELATCEMV
jgi:hypothetical protein